MISGAQDEERILDFEGFPGDWEILESAAGTGGERFKTRMQIDEAGELPAHKHPAAEESYEVLSGVLEVQVEGEWTELATGEKHTVPPGTAHAFRSKEPVEVINIHKPEPSISESRTRSQPRRLPR